MTTAARIWNNRTDGSAASVDRMAHYENILGQIATGVFILEPTDPNVPFNLEITFVNEMGARFFGRSDGSADEVLSDASH